MEDPQAQSFDDPALKAALRRALESSGAPSALRDRIRAMAAAEAAGQPVPSLRIAGADESVVGESGARPIRLFRRESFMKFAAAAVVVVGVGSLSYQVWQAYRPPSYAADAAYVVPPSLYKGMIMAHDERLAGSATPDTTTDFAAATELSRTIKRPVFAAKLADDGWKFEGAAIRDVGPNAAAQLFFTKGGAAISVFSLPASAVPNAKDDVTYDTVFNGHPIAGFVRNGGLFCIVGSSTDGALKVDEVKALLESHRGEIARG
jgi:hypothetical protein